MSVCVCVPVSMGACVRVWVGVQAWVSVPMRDQEREIMDVCNVRLMARGMSESERAVKLVNACLTGSRKYHECVHACVRERARERGREKVRQREGEDKRGDLKEVF